MSFRSFRRFHAPVHAAAAAAAALALVGSDTRHAVKSVGKRNFGRGCCCSCSHSDDAPPGNGTTRRFNTGGENFHLPSETSYSSPKWGAVPTSAMTTPLQPSTSTPKSSSHPRVLMRPMTPPDRWKVRRSGVEVVEGGGSVYAATDGRGMSAGGGGGLVSEGDLSSRRVLGRVRTYKDVEWSDGLGRSGSGFFQLVFEPAAVAKGDAERMDDIEDEGTTGHNPSESLTVEAHWIQFIRRRKWDRGGDLVPNENFPVDRKLWHRRGEWFLDVPRLSAGRTPYYDECALHNRSPSTLSVLDDPRGVFDPDAHSRCVIEFETYLVMGGEVVWRVHWEYVYASADAAAPGEIDEGYVNVRGCPASFISKDFECREGKWKVGYSHRRVADEEHTLMVDAVLPAS